MIMNNLVALVILVWMSKKVDEDNSKDDTLWKFMPQHPLPQDFTTVSDNEEGIKHLGN